MDYCTFFGDPHAVTCIPCAQGDHAACQHPCPCSHPEPASAGDDQTLQRLESKLSEAVDTFMATWMEWKAMREGRR